MQLSGPESSFQIKVNFACHLEIKVPGSGGRLEKHIVHVVEVQCEVSTVSDGLEAQPSTEHIHEPTFQKAGISV